MKTKRFAILICLLLISSYALAASQSGQKESITVNFTWTPQIPEEGQNVSFTTNASFGVNNTIWSWVFGDGGTSSAQNPHFDSHGGLR
jgi:PKD repeat protein